MKTINKLITFFALYAVFLLYGKTAFSQSFDWSGLGDPVNGYGVDGYVYSITDFNGSVIYGGSF